MRHWMGSAGVLSTKSLGMRKKAVHKVKTMTTKLEQFKDDGDDDGGDDIQHSRIRLFRESTNVPQSLLLVSH